MLGCCRITRLYADGFPPGTIPFHSTHPLVGLHPSSQPIVHKALGNGQEQKVAHLKDDARMNYETFVTDLAATSGMALDHKSAVCRLQDDDGTDVLIIEQGQQDGEAYLMSEVARAPASVALRSAVSQTFLQMNGVLEELPDIRITFNPETEFYLVIRDTKGVTEPAPVCEELIALASRLRNLMAEVLKSSGELDEATPSQSNLSV